MDSLVLLIQIPLLVFLIKYIRKIHTNKVMLNWYYFLLSFKVSAGFAVGIIYFGVYKSGDTLTYLEHLNALTSLSNNSWLDYLNTIVSAEVPESMKYNFRLVNDERSFFFIRLLSPLFIVTGSNYWILSFYLSIFSFACSWKLTQVLLRIYSLRPSVLIVSFFVFPSIVFWTSGVLKESLAFGLLCILIALVLELMLEKPFWVNYRIMALVLCSYLLFEIKFYFFVSVVAILFPYWGVKKIMLHGDSIVSLRSIALLGALLVISIGIVSMLHPLLNLNVLAESMHRNYLSTLYYSEGHNMYTFEGLDDTFVSFLPHVPKALVYGLFAPFLWHVNNLLSLICSMETLLILFLFFVFISKNIFKFSKSTVSIEGFSLLLYCLGLALFMGFVSPNFGTLVRYKIAYLPFFLLLLLNNSPVIDYLERKTPFFRTEVILS